uniref:CCDC66 domain-containing protein n=1 Tax=Elaeophora elaphi TaxID=1147741 RepID=A0A0R3RYL6_9BILA
MVRTYTWNPSTQSSLKIIGNFHNEDEKAATNSLPTASTNLYSTQCFSNCPIYKRTYRNDQVTNISAPTVPKDSTQKDATGSASEEFDASNNHIQCPVHMLQSQTASLCQPYQQHFPVYCPISLNLPTSLYHWRPHLFPSQITPIMLEQTTNLKPVDLWHLRPIHIGNKIYYEPVSSSPAFYSSPASVLPHTVIPSNLLSIPNNVRFQDGNLSHLPNATAIPVSTDNINGQNKLPYSKAASINHLVTSSNNGSLDLPWSSGTPQPSSGILGTSLWQTPLLVTGEGLIFDREVNGSSTVSSFQNPQCQASPSNQIHGSLCQHSLAHTITPSLQHQCCRKVTPIDSTEQYKRDLQLQIEQNRRRKEEERQRELEIERKEMIKFEEYRRKAQQEIEEEERREKEKILAAQRRAARMRTLQEEAALKAHHEAKSRTRRNVSSNDEGTKMSEKRTAESNHLEWWEKKKEHVNENARRLVYSPVIPALRKKNEPSDLSHNIAFEASANKPRVPSCVPSDHSNKSHSSSR